MKKKTLVTRFKQIELEIPYYEFGDENKGESVYITGGIHGDEINGIMLATKMLDWLSSDGVEETLSGKVTVVPVVNVSGFEESIREVWEDEEDLNRQFGYEDPNTISQQIAKDLTTEILQFCTAGVDCHDSGSNAILTPHSRIHISDKLDCVSCTREMAQLLGTETVLERDGEPNMMAVVLNDKYKIEALTIEIGGAGIVYDTEDMLGVGFKGIKNILKGYQILPGGIEIPKRQEFLPNRIYKNAPFAGVFSSEVKLGQAIHKGEVIGNLYNPITRENVQVVSDVDAIVFAKQVLNQVKKDDTLFSLLAKYV